MMSALFAAWPAALPAWDVWLLLAMMAAALAGYGLLARGFNAAVAGLERLPMWLWPLPLAAAMAWLMVVAPSGIPGFIYANF